MKPDVHPPYYPEAKVRCACGNAFTVGSTRESIEIEICSQCHPFYSGQEKIIDTAGRVERYKKILERAETKQKGKKGNNKREVKKVIGNK